MFAFAQAVSWATAALVVASMAYSLLALFASASFRAYTRDSSASTSSPSLRACVRGRKKERFGSRQPPGQQNSSSLRHTT